MKLIVQNVNTTLKFCLSILNFVGFLPNGSFGYFGKIFFKIYWFLWFMFLIGGTIIAQFGAMFEIWGDITLMTSASFLFFTNLSMAVKVINIVTRKREIQDIINKCDEDLRTENRADGLQIIKSSDRETFWSFVMYLTLATITVIGWAAGAKKNQLPLTAWYPYDTSKSPVYELTYAYQSSALLTSALVNACLDILVSTLIGVCCCRLRLVALSLRTLCDNVRVVGKQLLNAQDDEKVQKRLQRCVVKHDAVLHTAAQIQNCFADPILSQFTVSIVIICVTAYQLAFELNNKDWIRIFAMATYLLTLMLQVFLYCYQGNQLSDESANISDAAYWCPWYSCSVQFRRSLLIIMIRTRRVIVLNARGFTTLSLVCFTSIIKASYSFFTVLSQMEDRNEK